MSAPPPADPVPLATDGYPAASGVARREAGAPRKLAPGHGLRV